MLVAFFFNIYAVSTETQDSAQSTDIYTHGAVKVSSERAKFQNFYWNMHIPNQSQWTGEKMV